jgi:hypothetical protein
MPKCSKTRIGVGRCLDLTLPASLLLLGLSANLLASDDQAAVNQQALMVSLNAVNGSTLNVSGLACQVPVLPACMATNLSESMQAKLLLTSIDSRFTSAGLVLGFILISIGKHWNPQQLNAVFNALIKLACFAAFAIAAFILPVVCALSDSPSCSDNQKLPKTILFMVGATLAIASHLVQKMSILIPAILFVFSGLGILSHFYEDNYDFSISAYIVLNLLAGVMLDHCVGQIKQMLTCCKRKGQVASTDYVRMDDVAGEGTTSSQSTAGIFIENFRALNAAAQEEVIKELCAETATQALLKTV